MSKLAIVTGANTGIGRITAEELAKRGFHVLVACRSEEKARPVVEAIGKEGEFLPLDLADFESVRSAAKTVLDRKEPLARLVNNAGLAGTRGVTKEGFEMAFGTNHLGTYLFTRLLTPALEAADEARVVTVSSTTHYKAKGIDWDTVKKPTVTTTGMSEYEVSKLGNLLFSNELARRIKQTVHTYALHPGVVGSDVWREVPWGIRHVIKLFMLSPEDGAKTSLYCATSPDVANDTGRYYDGCKEKKPSSVSRDEALARELWVKSAAWTGLAE